MQIKKNTLRTSNISFRKGKYCKFDDSYLEFGFISREINGEDRVQSVLCMQQRVFF